MYIGKKIFTFFFSLLFIIMMSIIHNKLCTSHFFLYDTFELLMMMMCAFIMDSYLFRCLHAILFFFNRSPPREERIIE